MSLEENCCEQMVPSTFLSYLEDEVKEIKSLFWAGNYSNNLTDLKSIYHKNWRISTRECTSIFGFGSYPPKFTYEIPSKFHLRFPPIFMPCATKFPSFISIHHKISESESEPIKMSDDSDSDFGFGSPSPCLDDNEPSTTTQELVVEGARG